MTPTTPQTLSAFAASLKKLFVTGTAVGSPKVSSEATTSEASGDRGEKLTFLGHASLSVGLITIALASFLVVSSQASIRIASWYSCPNTKPVANNRPDVQAVDARLMQSCSALSFYYSLLSGALVVGSAFGGICALGTLYVTKEGLKEARNFVINGSITALGVYGLMQTLAVGFNADQALRGVTDEYVKLANLKASVTLGSTSQGSINLKEELQKIPQHQPTFNADRTIFSVLTDALNANSKLSLPASFSAGPQPPTQDGNVTAPATGQPLPAEKR